MAIDALRTGRCLAFRYDGLPRVVEVHTVGVTHAKRPAMTTFQIGGQSESTAIPDWKTFCFDECFGVTITDSKSAAPRPGYKPGNKRFATIDAQL